MKNKIILALSILALGSSTTVVFSNAISKTEANTTNTKNTTSTANAMANTSEATPNNKTQTQKANPISIILKDHARIRIGLARLNKQLNSNIADARNTFNSLKTYLINHETMEQTLWYPELEKNTGLKKIIAELKQEESDAGDLIKKIDGITNDKEWAKEVRKLSEAVLQHARDEETKLLPKAKFAVDPSTLNEIGIKMREYKNQKGML